MYNFVIFLMSSMLGTFVLTGFVKRYAIANQILDIPNSRSSHEIATPRGGGISIVVIFSVSLLILWFFEIIHRDLLATFIGSGLLVSGIGFWDDHVHVPAYWRLIFHFLASFWIIFWLGDIQIFNFIGQSWIGILISSIFLVGLLNVFNFMDGIDGIAASETIFLSCSGAFFFWLTGLEFLTLISLIFASSVSGFLFFNWPPAKIFMGDVGSGFLGLMLGIIIYVSILDGHSIWMWCILLAVFLTDSIITLLRRVLKGDKWYEAHCSHAYQHAAKKWGHKSITVGVIFINLLWLLPLSYLTFIKPEFSIHLTFIAYLPLIILAIKLNAGIKG